MTQKNPKADFFCAGDAAPCSGVFKVVHSLRHLAPHYVIALYRDPFPSCVECGDEVRFELALSAVYVTAHPAFQS